MVIASLCNLFVFILGSLTGKLHPLSYINVTLQNEKNDNDIIQLIKTHAFISSPCNKKLNDSMEMEGLH